MKRLAWTYAGVLGLLGLKLPFVAVVAACVLKLESSPETHKVRTAMLCVLTGMFAGIVLNNLVLLLT